MSFICPIRLYQRHGLVCSRVDVPLVVIGFNGEVELSFRFDTGCDVTTVSEDVATVLGLPTGGTAIGVSGVAGAIAGRLVSVAFRFPSDAISGIPETPIPSTWVVIGGRTGLALLSLQEVHARYSLGTDDVYLYFTNR